MIAFRDFVPRQLRGPRFGFSPTAVQGEYDTFDAAVAAANEWRSRESIRVINVETVVLPNIWEGGEAGSTDPALGTLARAPVWHQFVRVWYEKQE
jgi:hypothetical protein